MREYSCLSIPLSIGNVVVTDSPLYAQTLSRTAAGNRQTYDAKGKGKASQQSDGASDFLALDMAGGKSIGGMQQMELVEQEVCRTFLQSASLLIS